MSSSGTAECRALSGLPAETVTLKQYRPDHVLLSPRLAGLLDDRSIRFFLDHLDELAAQPHRDLELSRGSVKTWGIELADADDADRTYRALAAIEEEPGAEGATFLTLLALEEYSELEVPPRERMAGAGWRTVAP